MYTNDGNSDDGQNQIPQTPQQQDEESAYGHMPNPEDIEEKTVLEQAQDMGLYTEDSEEGEHGDNRSELNIAEEIQEMEAAD